MIIKGDINGDGKIDSADLILLRAELMANPNGNNSLSILTEEQRKAAEITNHALLSEADYNLLKAHIDGVKMINEVIS